MSACGGGTSNFRGGPVNDGKVLVVTQTVRVHSLDGSLYIEVGQDFEPDEFDRVIDTLGLAGRTDYHINYDAYTGNEVYVIAKDFLS